MAKKTDLERSEELYAFLQGNIPEGYKIPDGEIPRLDAEQAWTVIWYLGNLYWQVTDHVERCESCGELYNTEEGGEYREPDEAPVGAPSGHRCDNCRHEFDDVDEDEP